MGSPSMVPTRPSGPAHWGLWPQDRALPAAGPCGGPPSQQSWARGTGNELTLRRGFGALGTRTCRWDRGSETESYMRRAGAHRGHPVHPAARGHEVQHIQRRNTGTNCRRHQADQSTDPLVLTSKTRQPTPVQEQIYPFPSFLTLRPVK